MLKDPTRFEKPRQRRNVKFFASVAIKSKVWGKDDHTAEEYKTQIAVKIIEKSHVLPDGLEARKRLSTNLAQGNHDESMYHDAQGICIQNEVPGVPRPLATTASLEEISREP